MPEPTALPTPFPRLLADGAAVFPSGEIVVADLHLGKSLVFRRNGIAVPDGSDETTLAALTRLVAGHATTRLIIAGDFLHAAAAWDGPLIEIWRDWRARDPLRIDLVPGNHDRGTAHRAEQAGLALHPDGLECAGWKITHHPPESAGDQPTLAAHLHPVARLRDGLGRVPCFWWRAATRTLVLPAIGAFTGGHAVRPEKIDRLWLATGTGPARPLPATALHGGRARTRRTGSTTASPLR